MNSSREHHFIKGIVGFFLLLLSAASFAKIDNYTNSVVLSSSTFPITVLEKDNYASGTYLSQTVKNRLVLRLNPDRKDFISGSAFDITVSFNVTAYDKDGIAITLPSDFPSSFTIRYDNSNGPNKDQDWYVFSGAHEVTVNITAITSSGSNISGKDILVFDNIIEVERYSPFNPTTMGVFTSLNFNSSTSLVTAAWNPIAGAEEYDLEWTHVNNYEGTPGVTKTASSIDFSFINNNTRVRTSQTSYSFPAVFESGYILVRVRGIGRAANDVTKSITGVWSENDEYGKVSVFTDKILVTPSDDKKNWQFTANFAEEGKNKVSVSYFDGTLRNRQSVSRINSDNNVVVGESIYDHQGRAAIQVLPVPTETINDNIKYHENFNRNDDLKAYDALDFDIDVTNSCGITAEPMDNSSGAAKYYSTGSTLTGMDAYIPNSDGYPFSHIEYTPDNTGRISRQGGVGPLHQLGSKDTRYYYGKPSQEHLDRLFASEAGYFSHYKKNMVVDANGQVSVSYLDQQGRVIATSLAGDSPANLDVLPSNKNQPPQLKPDKLNINILDNQPRSPGAPDLVSVYSYLATSKGDHEFEYNVTEQDFDPECTANACYDCIYDLVISVRNECNEEMIPAGSTIAPIKKRLGKIFNPDGTLAPVNQCEGSTFTPEKFTVYLPEVGNYTIYKTLTVSEEALLLYMEDYINNNDCVTPLNNFIANELAATDFNDCHPKDNCQTYCEAKLTVPGQAPPTATEIAECVASCKLIDKCQISYEAMLADFYPGGQYAEFQELTPTSTTDPQYIPILWASGGTCSECEEFPYSIFNLSNGNLLGINYTEMTFGSDKKGIKMDGTEASPNNLSLKEFIMNWQPSWAEDMVKYHPEYCYYIWCSEFNRASDLFDEQLLQTETYQEALSNGYFNPIALDPFFHSNGQGVKFLDYMLAYFSEYTVTSETDPTDEMVFNLWQLAASSVICSGLNETEARTCAESIIDGTTNLNSPPGCNVDQIWRVFRALYLAEKTKLVEIARNCFVGGASTLPPILPAYDYSFDGIDDTDDDCEEANEQWTTGTDFLKNDDNLNYNCQGALGDRVTRFPGLSDLMAQQLGSGFDIYGEHPAAALTSLAGTKTIDVCSLQCNSYAETWLNRLKGCNQGSALWDNTNQIYNDLKTKLVDLCKAGCDLNNTLGSSNLPSSGSGIPALAGDPLFTTYYSFNDVVKGVMAKHGVNSLTLDCNGDLISRPAYYGHEYASLQVGDKLDTCACNKILSIRKYFDNGNLPPGITKAMDLFKLAYGFDVDNFDAKVCLCEDALELNSPGADLWTPTVVWGTAATAALANSGEFIQFELTCQTCPSCTTVQAMATDYKTDVIDVLGPPANPAETLLTQEMLTTHLNNELNLDLTYPEYKAFLEKCSLMTGNTANFNCTDITVEAWDLQRLLNLLADMQKAVHFNGGTSDLLGEACLCLPPYGDPPTNTDFPFNPNVNGPIWNAPPPYTNSLVGNTDGSYPNATGTCDHTYEFGNITGNTLAGEIVSASDPAVSCPIELTFLNNGFLFENIVRFMDIRPDPSNYTDGINYYFLINAEVVVGQKTVVTTLRGETSCFPIVTCTNDVADLTLCNPLNLFTQDEDPCVTELTNTAILNATQNYNSYIKEVKDEFRLAYTEKCATAANTESFRMKFDDNEYHYTLYYYDQAGNLIRTVPPEGVELLDITSNVVLDRIKNDRDNGTRECYTSHGLKTTYQYNSLNQLVSQSLPDHEDFKNWTIVPSSVPASSGPAEDLQMTGEGNGFFIGNDPTDATKSALFYTDDHGSVWEQKDLTIEPGPLTEVDYIDANNAWAVGEKGVLLKTTDGGVTWKVIMVGTPDKLADVDFLSATTGFVFTETGAVFSTADGGINWGPMGNTGLKKLDDASMGATKGFAVGKDDDGFGKIAVTLKNGTTWTPWSFQQDIKANELKSVSFFDKDHGFAGGMDGTILWTDDGGNSWYELETRETFEIKEVHAYEKFKALVLTADGELFIVENASYIATDPTKILTENPETGKKYIDIHFTSELEGYALLDDGTIYYTSNAGANWPPDPATAPDDIISPTSDPIETLNSFYIGSSSQILIAADGAIYEVTGDYAWTPLPLPGLENKNISQILVHTNDKGAAIVTGTGAGLYVGKRIFSDCSPKPCNPDAQWSLSKPGDFADLFFLNGPNARTVMKNGEIYSINFAGNPNNLPTVQTNPTCSIVSPTPTQTVVNDFLKFDGGFVAVGPDGNIFMANSICSNWSDYSKNIIPRPLRGVDMIDPSRVVAVGEDGTAMYTENGGAVWNIVNTGETEDLNTVDFYSLTDGFMAGDAFKIHYSDDGGKSWAPASATLSKNINDITYNANPYWGYVIGDLENGARQSAPGDLNWASITSFPSSSDADLKGVSSGLNNKAIIVGSDGNSSVILRLNSGVWEQQDKADILVQFNNLAMESTEEGYIAGDNGVVLYTDDEGETWTVINTGTNKDLTGVQFSGDKGVVVGINKTLRYTLDGGDTWEDGAITPCGGCPSTASVNFSDVTEEDGIWYAVGNGVGNAGVILKSEDAQNWQQQALPTGTPPVNLNAVELFGHTGYIAGNSSIILKSENCASPLNTWVSLMADNNGSDEKWTVFLINSVRDILNIKFKDARVGYATGTGGLIMKTIDAGDSWYIENSQTTANIISVDVCDDGGQLILGTNTSQVNQILDMNDKISSRFVYDRLGRLVASQNSKQFHMSFPRWSYTKYDGLGRIIEVGEIESVTAPSTPESQQYPGSGTRYEVTRTFYDEPVFGTDGIFGADGQQNLRNRVASVMYYDEYGGNGLLNCNYTTHYSYDIHGNVKTLIQDFPELARLGQQYKRFDYEYDLVSGNVNQVIYQDGQCDMFIHRYQYDADNRITQVETSTDGIQWDRDAGYAYYKHGPLARTEIGDNKVQGMDYAYTLQGWIKGVNSDVLDPSRDIGQDGEITASNGAIGRDAYGYSLGYYTGDYTQKDVSKLFLDGLSASVSTRDLFNGNIKHMTTALTKNDGSLAEVQVTAYDYDQLNRLKQMQAFQGTSPANATSTDKYKTTVSYDANGNITTLTRKGNNTQALAMDNLTYRYNEPGSKKLSNRLLHVNDGATASAYTEDIDNQGTFDLSDPSTWNYAYDKIGNLVKDKQEQIDNIEWTVYGKVKKVTRTSTAAPTGTTKPGDLEFRYDASGNRVAKIVKPRLNTGALTEQELWDYTYYIRDAQGNVMAVYNRDFEKTADATPIIKDKLSLQEHHIYGSSRLGVENSSELVGALEFELNGTVNGIYGVGNLVDPPTLSPCTEPGKGDRTVGKKNYELANHLGNVLVVANDRKIAVDDGDYDSNNDGVNEVATAISTTPDGTIDYYTADVVSFADYYPFGSLLPGRHQESANGYRFGFNGQEKIDEIKGNGNYIDFKYRGYDPRIGRFISVDPLFKKYPYYTPYAFSGNRVIDAFDLEGLEPVKRPQGKQGVDYFPVSGTTAARAQARVDAGEPLISRPFTCPDGSCLGFNFFLMRPRLNVSTAATVNPATPPTGGTTNTATITSQINFNPDAATFAPGAVGQVNNVAAQAQPTTATVPIGNPTTTRTVTSTPNTENLTTTTFTDLTTQQVQTTTTTSTVTVAFSTILPGSPADVALINARFNAISTQLQSQGIAAGNIIPGPTNFGVTGLPNNNQVNFNITTTTATGTGTQTSTTTTTQDQTFNY